MRFRKLRIGFSIASVIVGVLLTVLWVRSYHWHELVFCRLWGDRAVRVTACGGRLELKQGRFADLIPWLTNKMWANRSRPSDDWRADRAYLEQRSNWAGFGADRTDDGINVLAPLWFPVLLTVAFGAAPWVRRFSVRTLLIAMTLLAALLGIVVAFS